MKGPLVLALDIGTSSVRAILHDGTGTPVPGAGSHQPYQPRVAADGTAEVPVPALVRLVERAIDEAVAGPGEEIAAVGVSTFWHGLMGLEGRRPKTPLWLWSDSRSWRNAEHLRERADAEAIRQRTGCPIHPSYWPAKLAWAGARSVERWCSFGDYLYLRLFGELATSISMASATGLFTLRSPGWDRETMDLVGVAPRQLPEVADVEHTLPPARARRWPRLAGARWRVAAGDGALANLGTGCVDPRWRAVTIGTSGAIRVITEALPGALPEGLWCYRLDGRRLVLGGSFSNGGNFHAWVLDNFRIGEPALSQEIARMRPGAHGLVVLPLLAGERSPGFALRATGAIAGLTLATGPAEIARAGMEAIAAGFARVDQRLDEAAPGAELLVGSGVALLSSRAWMQMIADATGKPLRAARYEEASSRGAALFALEALGSAAPQPALAGATFKPDAEAHSTYAEETRRQERLYQALVVDRLVDAQAPAHMRLQMRTRSNGG